MHWTALLSYRRFPPSARVIDDLPCIKCGYNLRGIRVGDRCPECGAQAGDSLFVLAKSDSVGNGLTGIGRGYYGMLATTIGCLIGSIPIMLILICSGAIWRTFHAAQLRYKSAIEFLPIIGHRVRLLWFLSVADLIASLGLSAVVVLSMGGMNAAIDKLVPLAFFIWLTIALAAAGAAGLLGRALAIMLGYGWLSVLLRIQVISIVVCSVLTAFILLALNWASTQTSQMFLTGTLALSLLGIFAYTCIVMQQVANAAMQESDTWEEAIDMNAS